MDKFKYAIRIAKDLARHAAARRQSSTFLAWVLLTLLGMATAQSNPPQILRIPVSVTTSVNPCPGEPLQISGRIFIRVEKSANQDGSTQFKTFTDLQTLVGQGESSNTAYKFNNEGLEGKTFQCPSAQRCPSQLANAFSLSGTGPSQNVSGFIVTRIDEQPNGELTAKLERFDFVCQPQN